MDKNFDEFVGELGTLDSRAEFEASLARFLHHIGFEQFAYVGGRLRPSLGRGVSSFVTPPICAIHYHPEWANRYEQELYFNDDPIVRICLKRSTPLVWSERTRIAIESGRQSQIMKEAHDFDVCGGVAVPIHGYQREFGLLTANDHRSRRRQESLMDSRVHLVHLAAVHYHSAIQAKWPAPLAAPGESKLTARELEVLHWVAQGKSSWEISKILTISERTVKTHLEHAMRKLNVYTRAHAVAKSLKLGLLHG